MRFVVRFSRVPTHPHRKADWQNESPESAAPVLYYTFVRHAKLLVPRQRMRGMWVVGQHAKPVVSSSTWGTAKERRRVCTEPCSSCVCAPRVRACTEHARASVFWTRVHARGACVGVVTPTPSLPFTAGTRLCSMQHLVGGEHIQYHQHAARVDVLGAGARGAPSLRPPNP